MKDSNKFIVIYQDLCGISFQRYPTYNDAVLAMKQCDDRQVLIRSGCSVVTYDNGRLTKEDE